MIDILTILILALCAIICYLIVKNRNEKRELEYAYSQSLDKEREDAVKRSKAILRGNISQEMVPIFPDFPYNVSDVRHIGAPIDFIVYEGIEDVRMGKDVPITIILADCKVNTSKLSRVQRGIKEAIKNNRIRFEQWKIDETRKIKVI